MAFSVIPAKLHKPQLPGSVVSRTKLLKGSDRANVILVSAPAGSGKSTIISAWLAEQNSSYIWYSLDEWDNDLSSFFAYMIAGIKSVDEETSAQLEQMLDAFQTIGFEGFLKGFIHQLHAIDHPYTLVLDDYQIIQNDNIHQVIRTLLEHMPTLMKLVLITREDPPIPLAKLRANKELLELRISDLRFTEEEVKAFFLQQLNMPLQEEQLQLLLKRTEGWIAGLQLTALSIRGVEDASGFIEAFTSSHYYIMDYLMEEVLEHQPYEIKEFLLNTALLEFFSGELCDEVVQLEPGKGCEIIEQLVKTNSFIIPMDSSHKWYRYHHLFRDLLRQRIENRSECDTEKLHYRAGCWFKSAGREREAIYHFLKANASMEAAALIECKWAEMDLQLQAASWLDMAEQLPMSILENSPVLAMGYGWAMLDMGNVEGCEVWFDKAQELYDLYQSAECPENLIVNDTLQFDLLPATIASARGYIAAATGDIEGVFKHTKEAITQIPREQYQKRGVANMLLAVAHWGMGELNEAENIINQSIENARRGNNPLTYNSFYMVLGELFIQQGYLDKARALFEETISRVVKENQVPVLLASLYLGLAKISLLQGENQQAYTLLDDSKSFGQKYSLMDWKYKYYLLLARVYCSEGFLDLARDCLRESRDHYFMNPIPDDISFDEMEVLIDLAQASQRPVSVSKDTTIDRPFLRQHANQVLSEPLTVRELEVLGLIVQGLSNQEICDTLFLALSTVKGYNQTIYGKLQVKRRTEAVAKAKELGLA